MTTISLIAGRNYISFPATFSENFGTIFTTSGIKSNIIKFFTYDSILGYTDVSDFEYIDKGRGYILDIDVPGDIIYAGIEYTMTFDELRSHLLPAGWNLVGAGSNIITPLSWCRILDPHYNVVTQLEPTKAYWINYDDCLQPTFNTESVLYVIAAVGTVLFTIYLLREFRIIGKPMKE